MTNDEISDELREKAKVIAEATGRSEEKIIEDLLDDGVVNLSNEEKKDASLVEQLKEAAELIATVQSINQQVSDNTVLNGGQNKTEVAVETTLEGDIVDRAIASVERKAQNLRKIVVIIAPIMLLLTGGVGLDFFLDNEDGGDSSWEDDEYYEIWGCTAPDAENYMPDATDDDGSCYWDTTGPPCNEDWRWDEVLIRDWDANGEGYNNDIEVVVLFNDWNKCNRHMDQGFFEVKVINDENGQEYDTWSSYEKFHDEFRINHHVYDVPVGDYIVRVDYYSDGSHWSGPSALVTMENQDDDCNTDIVINELVLTANGDDLNLYVDYQDNGDCNDPTPIQMQLALYKNDGYQDYFIANNNYFVAAVGQTYFNINQDDNELMRDVEDGEWKIEFRWWIEGEEENCCVMTNAEIVDEIPDSVPCEADIDNLQASVVDDSVSVVFYIAQQEGTDCGTWDIEINLMPVDDNEEEEINHEQGISESSNYYSHTFNEVPNGDWQAEVILSQNENCASDCDIADDMSDWVYVNYQEPEEHCEINLFDWNFNITENHEAFFFYDLDCGYTSNDLEGYNVSTQFIVYPAGEIAQEDVIKYVTGLQYIQGYTDDTRWLKLDNFTDEETTHYDFYWYAVWVDGNETQQFIERTALNQEIITESEEPVDCSNLTLTSNSLVLGKDANNNLTLTWDLTHDGPDESSCYESIEIQITVYQNGTYYDLSEFQENGVHNVYANGTIVLDVDDVELFGDLPAGTYEVLVKYRIGTDVSADHFANSVSIS
tara:strand:+ start:4505 stop:6811 length:2307 start_codon:yes stop_codon:yes gene_type:complete